MEKPPCSSTALLHSVANGDISVQDVVNAWAEEAHIQPEAWRDSEGHICTVMSLPRPHVHLILAGRWTFTGHPRLHWGDEARQEAVRRGHGVAGVCGGAGPRVPRP